MPRRRRLYVPGDICEGSGKRCFKHAQEVYWQMRKLAKRRREHVGYAYHCGHCGLWHPTSQEPKE